MKILEDFSELTSFVHSEFMKIRQTYGIGQMNAKDLKIISKTILKAFSYANSTTKKKLKYYAKIDWAIYTAPHNWLWRLFHHKLWLKCQEEIARRKQFENQSVAEEPEEQPASPQPQRVDLDSLSLPGTPPRNLLGM